MAFAIFLVYAYTTRRGVPVFAVINFFADDKAPYGLGSPIREDRLQMQGGASGSRDRCTERCSGCNYRGTFDR